MDKEITHLFVSFRFIHLMLFIVLGITLNTAGQSSIIRYDINYLASSESNIYHSYSKIDETISMLNILGGNLSWINKPSKKFKYETTLFSALELYPSYDSRNQTSFGIKFSPHYKYSIDGAIEGDFEISRRNKELIDDQGLTVNRILKKWQTDFSLDNKYDFGKVKTKQTIYYSNDNYDETDTVTALGVDTTLRSYDYNSYGIELDASYKLNSKLKTKVTLDLEKRDYSERRTYTQQFGAFVGRPFDIRKYTETSLGLNFKYKLTKKNDLDLKLDYTVRKDNFENYYGFNQWQAKLSVELHPAKKHRTDISFRFKNKEYRYYSTSRTGNDIVSIDYADLRIEHKYEILQNLWLRFFAQNYNKVSNDYAFDYHNLTLGIGFKISG